MAEASSLTAGIPYLEFANPEQEPERTEERLWNGRSVGEQVERVVGSRCGGW
jgi:hypothetical protein